MGRRDAVQVVIEVIARMRVLEPRLIVSYEPGWETRGNGTSANYEGGIWHHTASASSASRPFPTQAILRNGRPDLSGPLCNFAGPWCTVEAPRIHVVAAHPANHAGASGGRAMGPLPVTTLFNPRVLGLEIDYAGVIPMVAGQLRVAQVWARAVADVVGGGDINRIRAHAETSVTGKFDIGYAPGKTYDTNALRRDSAALAIAPKGIFAMLNDAEQVELLARVRFISDQLGGPGWANPDEAKKVWGWPTWRFNDPGGPPLTLLDFIRAIDQQLNSPTDYRERPETAREGAFGHILSIRAEVEKLAAQTPVGGAIDYRALAVALADEADRRARDGDPRTGPTS